jgi:excinuclease ABC subunit B
MTKSVMEAISEIDRRREIQLEYNIKNNIDPRSTINEISQDLLNLDYGLDIDEINEEKMIYSSKKDIIKQIGILKSDIKRLAEELDFEGAIKKRDEMLKLDKLLLEI